MSWFSRKLRGELPRWVEAGVITGTQRASIEARYPADAESRRLVGLFAMTGAAIVAVGVALIVSANWAAIHDWVKITALVVLLVGVYAAGYRLRLEPGRFPRVGDALLMLGAVLFMSGVALVSQTFHLNARPPSGVLVWWLGIVAVPWLTHSRGAQFVSLAAGLIWLGMELDYPGGWLALGARWEDDPAWTAAGFLVGVAVFAGGLVLRRTSFAAFAGMHEVIGLLIFQSALYYGGFLRHEVHATGWEPANVTASVTLVGLALAGVVAAMWTNRGTTKKLGPWLALPALLAIASLTGLDLNDSGETMSMTYWISLLVFDVGLVYCGVKLARPAWINLALGFVALNLLTRYWDLFGTMLQGGVFFLVAGLLILGLAMGLARGRRRLVAAMQKGGGQ